MFEIHSLPPQRLVLMKNLEQSLVSDPKFHTTAKDLHAMQGVKYLCLHEPPNKLYLNYEL